MQFLNVLTDKYGLDRIQVEAINMGLDHAPDWKIILRHRLLDSSYAVNVRCGLKQAKSLAAMYYRSIFEEQFSMYLASIPQRYFPPVKSASLSKLRYPMGVDLEWDSSDLKKGFLITFCDGARYSIVKCPKCKIPPRARGILLSPQKKYFFSAYNDFKMLRRGRLTPVNATDVRLLRLPIYSKNIGLARMLQYHTGIQMSKNKAITMSFNMSKLSKKQKDYCAQDALATLMLGRIYDLN